MTFKLPRPNIKPVTKLVENLLADFLYRFKSIILPMPSQLDDVLANGATAVKTGEGIPGLLVHKPNLNDVVSQCR